ncbi:MAG: hypothetical protein IPG81_02755 [Sandaracinaceae bacterium]|nr:hypothetical protein [Sandaracinaceae bacterium]MBK8588863.1 hypothetical protein [Sandaracinaceae bacterium]
MTEAAFPILGAAFVLLCVLPAFSLLAKGVLSLLERDDVGGALHGLDLRYLLLTGASVLPLAWFLSAGLHQVWSGGSALVCLLDHGNSGECAETTFFLLTLFGLSGLLAAPALREHVAPPAASPAGRSALAHRLDHIFAAHPALQPLRDRVHATDAADFAIGTHGIFRPRVFVGSAFAARLTDDMLASALGHESEHVRSLDPLRYVLLRATQAVNPVGQLLLAPHVARWLAAREAHCDREAVIRGSSPLPLAEAILRAARPSVRELVALGARDVVMLTFRVRMLMAFSERPPSRCCEKGPAVLPTVLLLAALTAILPGQIGSTALDTLHAGSEHVLHYFVR